MNWLIHPIDTLARFGVRKWILGIVNSVLDTRKEGVAAARGVVAFYLRKVEALAAFIKSVDEKLADNKIDDAEADSLVDEAVEVAKALVERSR